MTTTPDHDPGDHLRPPFPRVVAEMSGMLNRFRTDPIATPAGLGAISRRPVVVVPGFMVHDVASLRMRRSIGVAGYDAHASGLGLNRGLRQDTLHRLRETVEALAEPGRPVSLVGWSLGGIFAREVAKLAPDAVDRVITLASPFSGDPRSNHLWRLYEMMAGHPVDRPPVDVHLPSKPAMRTVAIWSPLDGLVSPASTRGAEGERDDAVRIEVRHTEMISSPVAIKAVLEALL